MAVVRFFVVILYFSPGASRIESKEMAFLHVLIMSVFCLQVFETVEEACAWIPRENFSIIVDYILENQSSVSSSDLTLVR